MNPLKIMKMKKIFLPLVVSLLLLCSISCAQNTILNNVKELPLKAQSFLTQYFPNEQISYIKMDQDLLESKKYEIKFTSGADVDFDKNGEWIEVDCKQRAVPTNFIPAPIISYINSKFANSFITQIEKEHWGYTVELNNNLELEFNSKGEFKRIDD